MNIVPCIANYRSGLRKDRKIDSPTYRQMDGLTDTEDTETDTKTNICGRADRQTRIQTKVPTNRRMDKQPDKSRT